MPEEELAIEVRITTTVDRKNSMMKDSEALGWPSLE
jgi:hypothetical protein